jgi:hypothetical protein
MQSFQDPAMFADVRAAAGRVAPEVREYLDLGQRTITAALANRGTPATYAAFLTAFHAVEQDLPAVADALQVHASAASHAVGVKRVDAIQSDVDAAVAAIGRIGEVIGRVNEFQSVIAAAVEEQRATTDEISRSVAGAAAGSGEIAETIAAVAGATTETSRDAAASLQTATQLSTMADELRGVVSRFRY